jgi:hypothetical protein
MSIIHSLSNLLFNWIPFHKNRFLHKIDSMHFDAQGTNTSKSLFIIPKFDLHADIQLLKVRNEQKSLGFRVGHGQTIFYRRAIVRARPKKQTYFSFPHFLWFFSLKLIGSHKNLVWFGGVPKWALFTHWATCFSIEFLFTKIGSYTKLTQCISTRKELTIPNHFSSSPNSICMQIYSFSKSEMSENH